MRKQPVQFTVGVYMGVVGISILNGLNGHVHDRPSSDNTLVQKCVPP